MKKYLIVGSSFGWMLRQLVGVGILRWETEPLNAAIKRVDQTGMTNRFCWSTLSNATIRQISRDGNLWNLYTLCSNVQRNVDDPYKRFAHCCSNGSITTNPLTDNMVSSSVPVDEIRRSGMT